MDDLPVVERRVEQLLPARGHVEVHRPLGAGGRAELEVAVGAGEHGDVAAGAERSS